MRLKPCSLTLFGLAFALAVWLALVQTVPVIAQDSEDGAVITAPSIVAQPWTAAGPNTVEVQGSVTLDGDPVSGARVAVGGYQLPAPTNAEGQFTYPVDRTLVRRHPVSVVDAASARVGGEPLSAAQRESLLAAGGAIDVHYDVIDVATSTAADGTVVVSGTVQFGNGDAPPPVVLYSYRLTGTVTDAAGVPLPGMVVSTRTPEFRWTLSEPAGPEGHYTSLYWPTETTPFRVLLIDNNQTYGLEGDTGVLFPLYHSARMDATLHRDSGTITVTEPVAVDGYIYDGLLVGVMQGGEPVQPIAATWPDEEGHFQVVLPAELAGQDVQWWQRSGNYFSSIEAEPGGEVGLDEWPAKLGPHVARGFASVSLPGE